MKKFLTFLTLIIIFIGFTACSADKNSDYLGQQEEGEKVEVLSSLNRKIIYQVNATIETNKFSDTIQAIRSAVISEDAWFDNEYITDSRVTFKIRIKSDQLGAFTEKFSSYGNVKNYSKTATDISLNYEDKTNRVASLEAELARLNELYKEAGLSDMIIIDKRISEVSLEISNLKGELRQFDSLVDYSVVNLTINQRSSLNDGSFWGKIKSAFVGGWHALVALFKGLIIVISAILPFSIILAPIGVAILIYAKKKKNKKNQ